MKLHHVSILNLTDRRKALAPVRVALHWLLTQDRPNLPASIDLVIADDQFIRDLNRKFRGVDAVTDVLSFPRTADASGHLGDIAVCWSFAVAQAKIRGVRPVDEAAMLATHGALHLLGLEDSTERGRETMVNRQNTVMAAVGLPTDSDWHSLPHEDDLG